MTCVGAHGCFIARHVVPINHCVTDSAELQLKAAPALVACDGPSVRCNVMQSLRGVCRCPLSAGMAPCNGRWGVPNFKCRSVPPCTFVYHCRVHIFSRFAIKSAFNCAHHFADSLQVIWFRARALVAHQLHWKLRGWDDSMHRRPRHHSRLSSCCCFGSGSSDLRTNCASNASRSPICRGDKRVGSGGKQF